MKLVVCKKKKKKKVQFFASLFALNTRKHYFVRAFYIFLSAHIFSSVQMTRRI